MTAGIGGGSPERAWEWEWECGIAGIRPRFRDMKRSMPDPALREIPLFAGLSDEGLERVRTRATEVTAEPGQILALPGDVGSGMFVLLDGSVSVELRGGQIELAAPEFVGELALLLPEGGRVGRVRANTDVRCLSLSRADFEALLESEPSFARALLRGIAARLAASAS
jgi:sigma-B regulation protein RsbU (phosphoserine phosphatase)